MLRNPISMELMKIIMFAAIFGSTHVHAQHYNISTREWDRDFKKNKWSFIDRVAVERGRNSLITNIMYSLYGGGSGATISNLLDVGCGEGVLSDFLHGQQLQHYYGIDISPEAIKSARKKRSRENASATNPFFLSSDHFQVAAAMDFVPPAGLTYGAIVFNEMLYYTDYSKVLQKYAAYLEPPIVAGSALARNMQSADRREKGTPQSSAGSTSGVVAGQGGVIIISVWFSEGNEKMRDDIFGEARRIFESVDQMELSGISRNGAGPKAAKRRVSFHIECFRMKV